METTEQIIHLEVRATVAVRVVAWSDDYGTQPGPCAVKDDVENYILTALTQCPAAESTLMDVTGFAVSMGGSR